MHRGLSRQVVVAYGLSLSALMSGCSSDAKRGDTDGGAIGDTTAALDSVLISAGDSSWFSSCANNEDCTNDSVCHPYAKYCLAPGDSCAGHDECPAGSYCEASIGACLYSSTGTPCASDANCSGACTAGVCGCDAVVHERQLASAPLDVYFILDRTGSMGNDCDYTPGGSPPVDSKACFATYALSDYLIHVAPAVDMRLAFQFMSQPDDCGGGPYETPLVGLTTLPVTSDHQIIREISNESFEGGLGTHIEGALRGLAAYTSAHATPGREMIGVLMTDGNPQGCETRISRLRQIIVDHLAQNQIRTFIIGMDGATENNLEQLASAGGAEPHQDWCGQLASPCHYWNVGDGSGDAIASALQAIVQMAVPLPCQFSVADLTPPAGETLDYNRVNVTLSENGTTTTMSQVQDATSCPADQLAWFYDNAAAPTQIHLCPHACDVVGSAGDGARVSAVVGCRNTVRLH